MSRPHRVGIVCIDQARAIDAPGDNFSNHYEYKYREIRQGQNMSVVDRVVRAGLLISGARVVFDFSLESIVL